MEYPRLLFKNEKLPKVMPENVLEDLKLNALLPEEVSGFLLRVPDKENILLRQELFSVLLKNTDAADGIKALKTLLSHGAILYRALNRATCEKAEAYIFPFLLRDITEFEKKASAFSGSGVLLTRFSDFFSDVCGKNDFVSASASLDEILSSLANASSLLLKTDGDNTKVLKESAEDMTASLERCANELGITLSPSAARPFELQKSVAEAAAKLRPEIFDKATAFYLEYRALVHGEIFGYLEELEFISGILDFTRKTENAGIPHSFPSVTEEKKLDFKNIYDVTLILKDTENIVPNDAFFSQKEPFFYLTGANGGGKTTFLRALGVNALLFLAGAPVFCEKGEACVLDSVFTHFPRDERFEGSGRFFDEVRRVDEILAATKGQSLILLNETYATTGEDKALEYTAALADKLYKSGNFGLYITHQHELSENVIPFLGVMIDESDSNRRTYKIEKRRLPPRSFARDILEKYGLTRQALEKRFGLNNGK